MSTINLSGKEYELSTLNLNVMERIQEKWGCELGKLTKTIQDRLNKEGAKTLKFLIWAFLVDNYPEITEEQVGSQISIHSMGDHTDAIIEAFKE